MYPALKKEYEEDALQKRAEELLRTLAEEHLADEYEFSLFRLGVFPRIITEGSKRVILDYLTATGEDRTAMAVALDRAIQYYIGWVKDSTPLCRHRSR